MTNKEACEILTQIKNTPQVTWTNGADIAFDLAIKALEERPQGDLISREALKKYAIPCDIHNGALTELCVPLYQIDNAPTITFDKVHSYDVGYSIGYDVGYSEGAKAKEPRGKWITHQTGLLLWEECDQCGARVGTIGMYYCPNCGAKMYKEADNGTI